MDTMNRQLFHVVCHDCPFESLVSDPRRAERLVTGHTDTQPHAARYERIE